MFRDRTFRWAGLGLPSCMTRRRISPDADHENWIMPRCGGDPSSCLKWEGLVPEAETRPFQKPIWEDRFPETEAAGGQPLEAL